MKYLTYILLMRHHLGSSSLWLRLKNRFEHYLHAILSSASGPNREFERPLVNAKKETNIKGLYVIGDLAGAPVIKLAMAQGFQVIEAIASLPEFGDRTATGSPANVIDVIIVGAGAAGLNAALAAKDKGWSVVVLEKGKIANTIQNFPEGKWVYAEPDQVPPKGKLWLDGAKKEDLVQRWHGIVQENGLDVRADTELIDLKKRADGVFELSTSAGTMLGRFVVLATGQRGNPRTLGVPGEDQEKVYHRLYSPKHYQGENIIVVGGGNSAVEAALVLAEKNKVVISYRQGEFSRLFKDNQRRLQEAILSKRIEILYHSHVTQFGEKEAIIEIRDATAVTNKKVAFDHAFVLIGAELPFAFLKKLGIRLENDWQGSIWNSSAVALVVLLGIWLFGGGQRGPLSFVGFGVMTMGVVTLGMSWFKGNRYSALTLSFLLWYSLYGIKVGDQQEFWPFRGWGYQALSFFDRPWSFWYTVIYTLLMTVFGIGALKRWGLEKKDRFQILRFVSLISFQWIMFFLVPEFLFQYAVSYQWVGEKLANDPTFAEQAWRSYGLVYAWPLFFYTFFYDPHQIWVIWGALLTFVIIPIVVVFHGKRYCSWICGCGGLAETFGDRWRHLAPKGEKSIALEKMGSVVLGVAVVVTGLMLLKDIFSFLQAPADYGMWLYRFVADLWLVGILPVTLYPFLGGKVWCRYWCPLAKMMEYFSKFYAKRGVSKFYIESNDKCIACGECSRYCQVGINVMSFALKQEPLDNETTSCIGCGICITVCPMDTLSFGVGVKGKQRLAVVPHG